MLWRKSPEHSHHTAWDKPLLCPLCSANCSCSLTCVLFSSLTGSFHACHSWSSTTQANVHQVTVSSSYLLHADRIIGRWDATDWRLKLMEPVQVLSTQLFPVGLSLYILPWQMECKGNRWHKAESFLNEIKKYLVWPQLHFLLSVMGVSCVHQYLDVFICFAKCIAVGYLSVLVPTQISAFKPHLLQIYGYNNYIITLHAPPPWVEKNPDSYNMLQILNV